jgi:spore coat polysaccharide biosynthesis protein SpsF
MRSTRLPGKVLLDLAGRPMLGQLLQRLERAETLDAMVVATSVSPEDDAIEAFCAAQGVKVFRGSEDDVLSRVLGAAVEASADVVVRITADCPLIDPWLVDRVVGELVESEPRADYASNVLHRTYPRGLDTEALYFDVLNRVDKLARTPREREHVTITIRSERPELFRVLSVESETDDSDLRWTVDEARDLDLIRRLYAELDLGDVVRTYTEIVEYVRAHPQLRAMNDTVETWSPTDGERK